MKTLTYTQTIALAAIAAFVTGGAVLGGGRAAPGTGAFKTSLAAPLTAVVPVSIVSQWTEFTIAGGCTSVSAVRCVDLTVPLAKSTMNILTRVPGSGTNMQLRLRYHAASTTAGTVQWAVFGATGTDGYERLTTVGGADTVTITIDPTNDVIDTNDAAYRFTAVITTSALDCRGCSTFITDLEGGAAVLGAGNALASLQAKMY